MSKAKKTALIAVILIAAAGVAAFAYFNLNNRKGVAPNLNAGSAVILIGNQAATNAAAGAAPSGSAEAAGFGNSVAYEAPAITINSDVSKDFNVSDIKNISDMETAYGIKFSADDLKLLADRKFIIKDLTDTSIRPSYSHADTGNDREFSDLYNTVKGPDDYKARGQANAVFYSADVFTNAYNNIYTELLKEMENTAFYPAMKDLSEKFYNAAAAHLAAATTDAEKNKWLKARNYFAVPYAIFETAAQPLSAESYMNADGTQKDPTQVQADYAKQDATVDTLANLDAFVDKLNLDDVSKTAVLADVKQAYEAQGTGVPAIFNKEYTDYADQEHVAFSVDFSQFTPRAEYTSSSLRREYFRGMKWYIMLPFFLKSADLTNYAFAIAQLMAENPDSAKDYDKLEAAINFMVGTSDDLMPVDYLKALAAAKGASDQSAAVMDYLVKAHNPQIKDLAAIYPEAGVEQSADVLLKTKGMRFFSGKFILDSYWTGQLTQGDEANKPGYDQKLPPMASSLEVMALLGSDYAKAEIPKLDFYTPNTDRAINKALTDLAAENATYIDADWMQNLYTGWLWTIKGLFSWQKDNAKLLPQFMQSDAWQAKVLQTASAFWTELRHATILYAKQSFAELGGGGPGCDPRQVPAPPEGYVEPQLTAYARLIYLAKKTDAGLTEQGYKLANMNSLESFINLMGTVQSYSQKELENAKLSETVLKTTGPDPDDPTKNCTEYNISGTSDWENIRKGIADGLLASLPVPTEGPILLAKDKRAAIIADVHTGEDSSYPAHILYEGTGVPYVIFTAVDDANGPRLTVGFTYSHYEFTKLYGGQRLTDEDWQKNFYNGIDTENAFDYVAKSLKPAVNYWYAILFGGK
jgi:Protein of unknown function (DUF3160)